MENLNDLLSSKDQPNINNDKEKKTGKTPKETEFFAKIIGAFIVYSIPYYFIVWKNLPFQESKYKWLTTIIISIIVLLVTFYFQAKTKKVISILTKWIVVLGIVTGAVIISIVFSHDTQTWIFKIFVILYFSLLLPILYLQFISSKGKTLWDEYVCNLFRLKIDKPSNLPRPPRHSIYYWTWRNDLPKLKIREILKKKTIYQKKFEGLFGEVIDDERVLYSVFRGENLLPVALATLLVSVGWVFVVGPESIFGNTLFDILFKDGTPNNFIYPNSTPLIPVDTIRFAFLGAYFYILQMLIRRYFQNDLKTNAYIHAIMRIVIVVLLAWVLDLLTKDTFEDNNRLAVAFIIGVFPNVGWQVIQTFVKFPFKFVVQTLKKRYPLSDLDGLNTWYESRLLEEGIEDMQNLSTANLVDVMLNTRIPIERLVDWIDQSLLYLHLAPEKNTENSVRTKLRCFGIRSATDLEDAFKNNDESTEFDKTEINTHLSKLEFIINDNKDDPSVLRTVLATLKNDPNYYHVKCWKEFSLKKTNHISN